MATALKFPELCPFREIRLRDLDGVSDFLGVTGPAVGCGPSGCPLASGLCLGTLFLTIEAMQHIPPEDWPGVLANLHRAVRPGGLVYLTVQELE